MRTGYHDPKNFPPLKELLKREPKKAFSKEQWAAAIRQILGKEPVAPKPAVAIGP